MSRLTSSLRRSLPSLCRRALRMRRARPRSLQRENEEGKELMFANKYAEASAKFQRRGRSRARAEVLLQPLHVAVPGRQVRRGAHRVQRGRQERRRRAQGEDRQARRARSTTRRRSRASICSRPAAAVVPATRRRTRPIPNQPPPTTDPNQPAAERPPPTDDRRSRRAWRSVARRRWVCSPAARPENKYTWSLGVDFFGGGGRDRPARTTTATSTGGVRLQGRLHAQPGAAHRRAGLLPAHALRRRRATWPAPASRRSTSSTSASPATSTSAARARACASRRSSACSSRCCRPANESDGDRRARSSTTRRSARASRSALQYALGSRYEHVTRHRDRRQPLHDGVLRADGRRRSRRPRTGASTRAAPPATSASATRTGSTRRSAARRS